VSPVGEPDDRTKVLGFYTPERKTAVGGELTSYAIEELHTRIYGNTAVAIARLPFTMTLPGGQTTSRAFRCTFILVRSGSSWQVASSHFSAIDQPDPPAAESR
jgi:ketosteroid isomerase-like protein